jgi:hypothetical protein
MVAAMRPVVVFGGVTMIACGALLRDGEPLWSGATILAMTAVERLWERRHPMLTLTRETALYQSWMSPIVNRFPWTSIQSWGLAEEALVLVGAEGRTARIPFLSLSPDDAERVVAVLSALLPKRRDDAAAARLAPHEMRPRHVALVVLIVVVVLAGQFLVCGPKRPSRHPRERSWERHAQLGQVERLGGTP